MKKQNTDYKRYFFIMTDEKTGQPLGIVWNPQTNTFDLSPDKTFAFFNHYKKSKIGLRYMPQYIKDMGISRYFEKRLKDEYNKLKKSKKYRGYTPTIHRANSKKCNFDIKDLTGEKQYDNGVHVKFMQRG